MNESKGCVAPNDALTNVMGECSELVDKASAIASGIGNTLFGPTPESNGSDTKRAVCCAFDVARDTREGLRSLLRMLESIQGRL